MAPTAFLRALVKVPVTWLIIETRLCKLDTKGAADGLPNISTDTSKKLKLVLDLTLLVQGNIGNLFFCPYPCFLA